MKKYGILPYLIVISLHSSDASDNPENPFVMTWLPDSEKMRPALKDSYLDQVNIKSYTNSPASFVFKNRRIYSSLAFFHADSSKGLPYLGRILYIGNFDIQHDYEHNKIRVKNFNDDYLLGQFRAIIKEKAFTVEAELAQDIDDNIFDFPIDKQSHIHEKQDLLAVLYTLLCGRGVPEYRRPKNFPEDAFILGQELPSSSPKLKLKFVD